MLRRGGGAGGKPRKLRRIVLVAVVAWTLTGGALLTAAMVDHMPASDVPAKFGVPEPHVGDAGVYTVTVVETGPGGTRVVEEERTYLEFAWLPPTELRDAEGRVQRVPVRQEQTWGWNSTGHWAPGIREVKYLDPQEPWRLLAYEYRMDQGGLVPNAPGSGVGQENETTHLVQRMFVEPGGLVALPFCGLHSALQGASLDPRAPTTLFRRCNLRDYWMEALSLQAVGVERIGDGDAVRFILSDLMSHQDVRAWFDADMPVPVKLVVKQQHEDNRYDVLRLTRFAHGKAALPDARSGQAGLPDLDWAPRQPWGPEESGVEHIFPLSEAWALASHEAGGETFQTLLRDHPDARALDARYSEVTDHGNTSRTWTFTVAAGGDALQVTSAQWEAPRGQSAVSSNPWLRDIVLPRVLTEVGYVVTSGPQSAAPDGCSADEAMPTVASLASRWQVYASKAYATQALNTWGFRSPCDLPPDDPGRLEMSVGVERTNFTRTGLPVDLPWAEGFNVTGSLLTMDASGRPTRLVEWTGGIERELGDIPSLGSRDTGEPLGRTAGSALAKSDVLVQAGMLSLVIAALLALGTVLRWAWVGLFSRLERPTALLHPTRARIHALVSEERGIHFHDIERRLDLPQTTVHYHLGRLVKLGILTAVTANGHTSYFRTGSVDRRDMPAATVLRSDGARRVLNAVVAAPGATPAELAAQAALSLNNTRYHIGRMQGVGLLRAEVTEGRMKVFPTELGQAQGGAAAA